VGELHKAGVAAAKDLQQAESDEIRAKAEASRAKARLVAYGADVDGAGHFVLKSPIAGVVVERNANPGQELRPDQPGAPLFVVTDPRRLWVTLDANETDLAGLSPGMALFITSKQFPDDAFAGTLVQLADFVDPTSRTVKLRGEVPNPQRALKAEMFVSARLKLPAGELPTVSARAVYLEGVRRYVFVRTGEGEFTRRAVRVGPDVDGRMAVLSGLKAGEEAVVAGNLFLQQILASARTEGEPAKAADAKP
jgi:cobalt-zinc-cadmium efflux system membrane fusion protein